KARFGDLVHGDVVERQLTTHGSTLLTRNRSRISLRPYRHAVLLKALHRIIRMEHHHQTVILHPHAQTQANFAHTQVSSTPRPVVVHDPVTAAKARKDQVHVRIAEYRVAWSRTDLLAHVRTRRVQLRQYIVTHVVHHLAFFHDRAPARHTGREEQAAQTDKARADQVERGGTGSSGNHQSLLGGSAV